jgi:hypothetical protein
MSRREPKMVDGHSHWISHLYKQRRAAKSSDMSNLINDGLSAQILENKECRPILTHIFSVEIETQLSREDAKHYLCDQIHTGQLNKRYSEIQKIWPNFGGAKINIK